MDTYDNEEKWFQVKKQREEQITLSSSKLGFILKFLKGSKYITKYDKKTVAALFVFSSMALGG